MSGWWGWTGENITRAHWTEWRTGGVYETLFSLNGSNLLLLMLKTHPCYCVRVGGVLSM